ncbi:MAG: type II toxin-antitoxin system prevent-host-death family antitoxin [Elusimicrobiota bacterium]
MQNLSTLKPEYVVDKKGKRKAVILSYKEFERLIEDINDLRDIAVREKEPSRPYAEYHRERIAKK